ncbi:T9SS type A sorting domain-containing protein [Corallibacter vietnamensis]|uniref:T9SS type A sorting domain-containing protein n=1 Tax=Corallibacter vietnamensis TaxID=904130 RepID=A0ABP7H6V8_9FLAO
MKRQLLVMLLLIIIQHEVNAQIKSTGVVNLLPGMTAKLDLDNATSTATLTLTGPSDRWFALQFGDFNFGDGMSVGEDIIYFNGARIADAVHNGIGVPPSNDTSNWSTQSNEVSGSTRTLVATRNFDTGDSNDYIFDFDADNIDFAFSRSSSAGFSLAYHGFSNRGYAINNAFTTLGIDEFETKKSTVKLVPNPAVTAFYIITNSKQDIIKVTIFNALGQEVMSIKNGFYEDIDISGLSVGNYYVEVRNNRNEITIKKLLKQ